MAIAPVLRSSVVLPAGTGATSRTMNKPAGVVDGDVMLAAIVIETTQNPVTGLTPPAGWTLELDHYSGLVAGQEGHILVYSKRASGEGASYTWSWTSLLWQEGTLLAYSGCPPSGAYLDIISAATPVNGTSITWQDTTLHEATELAFFLRQFSAGAFTGPGTEVFDGGTTLETACYDVAGPATPSATGIKTFTSAGSGQFQAVGVSLIGSNLPVLRAVGASSTGTTGAVTVAAPAGVATGDLEILVASTIAGGSISITTAGGSAWTAVGPPQDVTAGEKLYVWWRIRQAGDTDPAVTPGSDHSISCRLAYKAGTFNTITPFDAEVSSSEATSDTSFSWAPGTSTTQDNSLVLCIATSGVDSASAQVPVMTNANLSALVSRANINTTSGGGGGFGITEGALVAYGPVGTFACTYAGASPKAYISFAICPAFVAPRPPMVVDFATARASSY